jgi:hypothetical protein
MKPLLIAFVFGCALTAAYAASAADGAPGLTLEQELFNDFAGRLQHHLHHTAQLLDKIRASQDPKERSQLMKDYAKAMQTTTKANQAMQALAGGGAMMMVGRKMAGGMGCGMMRQQSANAQAANGSPMDASADAAPADPEAGEAGEHEGHH